MKKICILIVSILMATSLVEAFAQFAPASAPAPVPASAIIPAGPAADSEQLVRDPFWPPDYWPKKKDAGATISSTPAKTNEQTAVVQTPVADNVLRWPEVKVKGLIRQLNGNYGAMIEGVNGMVEAGQVISIVQNGMAFRFKIKAITEKGVIRQKLDYKPARR